MDANFYHLAKAQDDIHAGAQHVAEVVNHMTAANSSWGTQRLAYLSQAIQLLNLSWSMVRAAINECPVTPSVQPLTPISVPREIYHPVAESKG